jgi:hypothetical protein
MQHPLIQKLRVIAAGLAIFELFTTATLPAPLR